VTADLAIAVAVGAALLLIAAGVGHLRHRPELRAALTAQALLPRRLRIAVEALIPAAELAIGLAVVASLMLPAAGSVPLIGPAAATARAASLAGPALIAQTVLYGGFAGYLWVVYRRRPTAPCGCFASGGRVTPLVIARALLFAAGSGAAAAVVTVEATGPAGATVALVWLTGGFVTAMLGWLVPALADGP
jgi:hypothetical protein